MSDSAGSVPPQATKGPLAGVKVIEIAGLGAAPYGCMMLADMGAEVVRVDRIGGNADTPEGSPLLRNRRSMTVDLKQPAGRDLVLEMVSRADVLVEAFRPGVAERLGVGPEPCMKRNGRLVYARMTGWGQTGPLADRAGHDLNYIGLAGVLHQIGPTGGKPVVPLNVIGDFGGGGLLLAYGIVCAVLEARQSGRGQIVDAAMLDGALSFMAMFFGYREAGQFSDRTGAHLLGGGAHYYEVYETSDGGHLAVAAIEPQFYRAFLQRLGLSGERWSAAGYPASDARVTEQEWPALKAELAARFRTKTRDEWCTLFAGTDACVTPVLTLAEAARHPHNIARRAFMTVDGVEQNAPAPRFSRTAAPDPRPPRKTGADTLAVLADWGVDPSLVARARDAGALDQTLEDSP
ncbi:MAG: alpha-methylacyl-CoA racemase [Gammaproteobacteria bacterium]|jgi:alpha-methylacyl-CoA racemase|nr:alpha-methylacyl-CoA racemase [Gammaproteobacteria bacterium]